MPRPLSATDAAQTWSPARIARLGFLVGQGWDAGRVARDPVVDATPLAVRLRASRLGLVFGAAAPRPRGLSGAVAERLEAAASKRRLSRERLIAKLVQTAATHDGLIDNILDDGD